MADIVVGSPATDRGTYTNGGYTIILLENPASTNGVINKIEVYAVTGHDLSGFRVGSFYNTGGTDFKCRASVTIGAVTSGSKQTFSAPGDFATFAIQSGDYLGAYWDSGGWVERDGSGYAGGRYISGEYIDPGDEATYSLLAGNTISLYGEGEAAIVVTPTTATLTLTGYAPILKEATTPTTLNISTALYTPSIIVGKTVTPTTLSLSDTEYAPILKETTTPSTLSLSDTEYAPILKETTTPTTLSLTLTEYAPSLISGTAVTPTTLTLTLTEYAPILQEVTTPSTLSLSDTEYAPILQEVTTPTTLTLVLTEYIPEITIAAAPLTPIIRVAFDTDPMDAVPTWTDITADVRSFSTRRGRQHELNRMEGGTAEIELLNTSGNYWPLNAGGDYFGKVLPGKKVNIQTTYGATTYDLFTGFVESWEPGWTANQRAITRMRAVGINKRFSRHDMNNAGEAEELSGTRVGNILDEIGWPAADRDLDSGQTTVKATGAQVAVNAMTHLFLVQDTEVGIIFLAADGDVQFQDRHARLIAPYTVSQATFGEDGAELGYRMIRPSYDDYFIYNDIRRTRVGGAEQTASDATSQGSYGKSTNNKTGLLMLQDTEAKDQCDYMLAQYKDPAFRISELVLFPNANPGSLFPLALGSEISTRITLRNNEAHLDQDFHIEGITHSWNPAGGSPWTTTWQLSNATNVAYWAIGVAGFSEIGETTRLAY